MKQNLSTNLISIISITFAVISFFYGFYIDEISMGAGGYNGDFVFVTKSIDLFSNNSIKDSYCFLVKRAIGLLLFILYIPFNPFLLMNLI